MKTLHFEGSSDDTFGMTQDSRADDFDNCASGEPIDWLLQSSEGSMIVRGQYCPPGFGGWVIGVGRSDIVDDDTPLPNWPMRFEHGAREYSPRLVIEVPDDTTWVCLQAPPSED